MDSCAITDHLKCCLPFWSRLSDAEKSIVVKFSSEQSYAKGEELRNIDAECIGGFLVLDGIIRVYIMGEEGRQVTLMRLHKGETCFLGASCVLHSIAFDVFMEAEEDANCLIISPIALKKVFDSNMSVENFVLNSLIERFSDVMWTIQQILFMSMDRRLAIFLYEESTRTNDTMIRLTQEQIAQAIGSAREVVSRMFRYFGNEGITKSYRGGIEIIDKNKLRTLALKG